MQRVRTILKRIGKFLLWAILVLAVLMGSLWLWLRAEPREVTECEAGFRLIKHAEGTDCILDDLTNIGVAGSIGYQLLIAVEQKGLGLAENYDRMMLGDVPGLYDRYREINEGVTDFGNIQSGIGRNLELLVDIEADVIITDVSFGDFTRAVEAIAPVIVVDPSDSWKEKMLFTAEIIGEREAAETMMADYEARVVALQEQFDDPSEITVSSVWVGVQTSRVLLPKSFAGQIITDVGFSFPEEQLEVSESSPNMISFVLSEERMDLLDADYLFPFSAATNGEVALSERRDGPIITGFRSDPLYSSLKVVQAGNDYEVDLYWGTEGIYSAHAVLDDLFLYVAGVDPEEVAPNPLKFSD
ncbi:MAG: ABC transporter substrate-binding protein [Chloroflexota bacterium]